MKRDNEQGFTFLEIIISLSLLAGALTILLGLQSSVISRTLIERQQREAMSYARSILSAVEARETAGNPLSVGTIDGSPKDVIEELIAGISSDDDNDDVEEVNPSVFPDDLFATLNVEYWGLPNTVLPYDSEKAMKRIELRLRWGERTPETLQFLFFIPFDEDDVSDFNDDDNNDDDDDE